MKQQLSYLVHRQAGNLAGRHRNMPGHEEHLQGAPFDTPCKVMHALHPPLGTGQHTSRTPTRPKQTVPSCEHKESIVFMCPLHSPSK